MGENTAIEWADHTFNPWSGCTKVSPGCANCYAEKLSSRFDTLGEWGPGAERKRTSEANWRKPLKWNREAAKAPPVWQCASCGAEDQLGDGGYKVGDCEPCTRCSGVARVVKKRPRVFCASLADWLDPEVPADWLADLLALIAQTPHLDWLLLTKRPELWRERMRAVERFCIRTNTKADARILVDGWLNVRKAPSNVWVGTSVEDQARADERIPHLLQIPARIRFLSCEPLLGAVDLENVSPTEPGTAFRPLTGPDGPSVHWVIAGGESGPGARFMHPQWARSLRDQCQAAGVAFFMKQIGGARKPFPEIPGDLLVREFPHAKG